MHIVQRGHDRAPCFFSDRDRTVYLGLLQEFAAKAGCGVHAYVLMDNHVHLLLTPVEADSSAHFVKAVSQRYVQFINRTRSRSGTLWEGRYFSSIVHTESYFLRCQRYVELNPVRARMVKDPGDFAWSSFHANARGDPVGFLEPHALYMGMGRTASARRSAYRAWLGAQVPQAELDAIRAATHGNHALGPDDFILDVEARLGLRAAPRQTGRPRKGLAIPNLLLDFA